MQQRAETRQLNSKLTAFLYNSILIIILYICDPGPQNPGFFFYAKNH